MTGLLSAALWLYGSRVTGAHLLLATAATTLTGLAALLGWKRSPVGQLVWDGQFWRWEGLGYQAGLIEQKLSVVVDFQRFLLLRLEDPAHAQLWLWAESHAMPERWLDLRRAVYSPQKPAKQISQDSLQPLNSMPGAAVSSHAVPTNIWPKP